MVQNYAVQILELIPERWRGVGACIYLQNLTGLLEFRTCKFFPNAPRWKDELMLDVLYEGGVPVDANLSFYATGIYVGNDTKYANMLGTALVEPLLLYDLDDSPHARAEYVVAEIARSGNVVAINFNDERYEFVLKEGGFAYKKAAESENGDEIVIAEFADVLLSRMVSNQLGAEPRYKRKCWMWGGWGKCFVLEVGAQELYVCAIPVKPIANKGLLDWFQCDPAEDRPRLMFLAARHLYKSDEKEPVDALMHLYDGPIRLSEEDIGKLMDMLSYIIDIPLFLAGLGYYPLDDMDIRASMRRVGVEVVQTPCGTTHVYLDSVEYTFAGRELMK